MARLNKRNLLAKFEEAVRFAGWSILFLNKGEHPARYRVFRDELAYDVKVYVWNITHGGAGRKQDEYRIQITGIDSFELEANGLTLILGWWDDVGVFAGWDVRHHLAAFGGSPSMQISEGTLRRALVNGFATYINQKNETAVAFRPDFVTTYLQFLEPLHDSGQIPAEASLLNRLSDDPDSVTEKDIEDEVQQQRQYAVISTKKALRAIDFRDRVLNAYRHRCSMCGTQLRLVDGAHILPVAHQDSTDRTDNGVALCALHHRAYDRSLVTFDEEHKVHLNEPLLKKLKDDDLGGGLKEFRAGLRPIMHIPPDKKDRPSQKFVRQANELRGWTLRAS